MKSGDAIEVIDEAIEIIEKEAYWFYAEKLREIKRMIERQPEIVRCKDCKHRPTDPENKGLGQSLVFPDDVCPCQIGDNWYSWMPKDNWFCADGERRQKCLTRKDE